MSDAQREHDAVAALSRGVDGDDTIIAHDDARRRRAHDSGLPHLRLNLTAMIDVVFLLLMYFLLIAEFRPREESLDMELPEPLSSQDATDPFALPDTPISIRVRSTGDDREAFTMSTTSPLLGELGGGYDGLYATVAGLRGDVLRDDQRFVIVPAPDVRWEHVLGVLNTLKRAGFVEARFAEPRP